MATTARDFILVERHPPIVTVTINRPRQRNAINYAMWGELADLLADLDRDRTVRVVVITGAGDVAFSAGADIADFDEYRADSAKGKVYNAAVDRLLDTLAAMDTPTISMIRGFAAGGGCELGRGHGPAHRRRGQPARHSRSPPGHQHRPPGNAGVGQPGRQGECPLHPDVGTPH